MEIFHNNKWHLAANVELYSPIKERKGFNAPTFLSYEQDYAVSWFNAKGLEALSCNFPVNLETVDLKTWPAFLLDIVPSGQARRYWEDKIIPDQDSNIDWELLLIGAGNPPGNIRVKEAASSFDQTGLHLGFSREEIIEKKEDFLEYALAHGAPVTGSTGAQGDSVKFLLTEDHDERWHADGALPDTKAKKHWIIKFARGHTAADKLILRSEPAYLAVAKLFGIRTGELPKHEDGALFIPRFDRIVENAEVKRIGLESLCSLAGISEFGARIRHERICEAIVRHCTEPVIEIKEYIRRDILNLALKNTDNHARNQAVCKYPDGLIALSPHYDFAPMFLDPEGIIRVCRWEAEQLGIPDWNKIAKIIQTLTQLSTIEIKSFFKETNHSLIELSEILKDVGIEQELIKHLVLNISELQLSLAGWIDGI